MSAMMAGLKRALGSNGEVFTELVGASRRPGLRERSYFRFGPAEHMVPLRHPPGDIK